ncbi:MAG: glucose 1-dehydrogenase [TACK group archaeon]|nr:glucose 1-dehydrogenase [TACK group archaeon]
MQSVLDSFSLKGRSAVVTGASSGLGVSFAEALAEAGADVLICARRQERLIENAERISSHTGRKVVPFRADVTVEEDVRRTVEEAERQFGKIDILVNNAGMTVHSPTTELSRESWQKEMDTNVTSVFLFSKYVIRSMLAHKVKGKVINIASISGLLSNIELHAAYYASKGAVVNLTRALATEFARDGIRVNAIAPGYIATEMTAELFKDEKVMNHIRLRTPMGRPGTPDELKGTLVYLASDASSYVTGAIIPVDGGWTAF